MSIRLFVFGQKCLFSNVAVKLLSSTRFDYFQSVLSISDKTQRMLLPTNALFSTSVPLQKVKKAIQKKSKKIAESVVSEDAPLPADSLVAAEVRADVRDFENIDVTISGKQYKMNHLGRITMRSGDAIMINFSENPASIKEAKAALEKAMLGLNPQQEGAALHVPLPKVTRERREQAVKNSKKIFNDYRSELNRVFAKHDKRNSNSGADLDTVHNRSAMMLEYKRQFDDWGEELLEEKQKAVMQEIK